MKKLTILILLAMAVVCQASAQNRVVTGTVSEEDGTPLTGAVVQVVGTNNAATAAIDGLYTLKNVPSGAVLRVSFLGYDPVEKAVLPACPCKTFPELSAPPRKSAFAALRRSSETLSRCGWWTV